MTNSTNRPHSQLKTFTSAGKPVAWFTLRIKWHSWAQERKLSNPQTVRCDFRHAQNSDNLKFMLMDLLDYIVDYCGEIEEVRMYDNRRAYPHNMVLIYRYGEFRDFEIPACVADYYAKVKHQVSINLADPRYVKK